MTGKIFRSTLAAALTVLLASLLAVTGCLYRYFGALQERQLQAELNLAAAAVEADGEDYLRRVGTSADRLTWVAADGTVLFDTREDAASMGSHAQREEIREALTQGRGSSTRYSDTRAEKTVYQAVRLSDGTVLRIAASRKTPWMLAAGMLPMCSPNARARIRRVLEKYSLPTKADVPVEKLIAFMGHDKKATGGGVVAVCVDEIGSFEFKKLSLSEIAERIKT